MSVIRKIIGLFLIIAAVGGLIFSIVGLTYIYRIEARVTKGLTDAVDTLSQTLDTVSYTHLTLPTICSV